MVWADTDSVLVIHLFGQSDSWYLLSFYMGQKLCLIELTQREAFYFIQHMKTSEFLWTSIHVIKNI